MVFLFGEITNCRRAGSLSGRRNIGDDTLLLPFTSSGRVAASGQRSKQIYNKS